MAHVPTLLPPEGIALLLEDIFEVKCHFGSIDAPEAIFPAADSLFAEKQFLSRAEMRNLLQNLPLSQMAFIIDRLVISWLVMRTESHFFLVGPFQSFPLRMTQISNTVQKMLPGANSLAQYHDYRASLPSIEDHWLKSLIRVFSRAICGESEPIMNWIELFKEELSPVAEDISFNTYAQSAYEIESAYLEAIYFGNTQQALESLRKIHARFQRQAMTNPNMLIPGIYGNAVNCTLARIAAYQAGVSPIILDEIFQEQMTLAITGKDVQEQFKQAFRMTTLVCKQVQAVRTEGCSSLIRNAICYLLEHYQQPVKLDQTADILGVHKNYLSTAFSKETGKSFIQYLNDLRLEQASIKIRLSDLAIGDIAASVGIPDQNYFARLFQKKYHMSPMEWRKQRK